MPKIYKVGGCVRDKFLGVNSKDIDFTFVLDNLNQTVEQGFDQMTQFLQKEGYTIFLSTPDCFTIRAKFPKDHKNEGLVADFVMARKEIGYIKGTRKPILELGTLYDDLLRRDFTLNAMAEDDDGEIIDYFEGRKHLEEGLLITPQDPKITLLDDPLRLLRAIRFSITKNFEISPEIISAGVSKEVLDKLEKVVSQERIREELTKCFKADTLLTIEILLKIPTLMERIFKNGLWLIPTTKE
jgi:poly(A) polymerase